MKQVAFQGDPVQRRTQPHFALERDRVGYAELP
jgi:hypothetical protein